MRMMRASGLIAMTLTALLAGACGDPKKAIAEAAVASGDKLKEYAGNISESVDLVADADLVQRFCQNAFGTPCPADITDMLADNGFGGGTGVDLAHAFVVLLADRKDGETDQSSSDEDYLDAAYHVVLARAPDTGGAVDNLTFIQDTGNRKQLLRAMLQSDEFKMQR